MGVFNSTLASIKEEVGQCACIEPPKELSQSAKHGEEDNDDESLSSDGYSTDNESSNSDGYTTGVEIPTDGEGNDTDNDDDIDDDDDIDTKSDINNINIEDSDNESITATFTTPMIEFPISSSSGISEPIPSDLETLTNKKENESLIPQSSKRIISLSHLLANVLKEYFESDANQCEFGSIDVEGILQHIVITGDCPRNYLLGIPMDNNLDIIVDTRQLTKLHLNHLKKYHSTNKEQTSYSQCILWNHYLNKFENESIEKDIKLRKRYKNIHDDILNAMRSIEYISECGYILNSKFLTSILLQSKEFENKLSIYRNPDYKYNIYQFQIIDELLYGEYNLDGENFNIFDHHQKFYIDLIITRYREKYGIDPSTALKLREFHSNTRHKLSNYQQQNQLFMFMEDEEIYAESELHIRLSTRRLNDAEIGAVNLIKFEIPKYKHKLSKCIENYDLSLSFFILPLCRLVDYFDDGFTFLTVNEKSKSHKSSSNDYIDENIKDIDIDIDYQWRPKILNGVNNYNSFNDLENKILIHPNPNKIIKIHKPEIYFFRLIKICIQSVQFTIHQKIIDAVKQCYKSWIDNDQFLMHYDHDDDSKDDDDDDDDDHYDDIYRYELFLNTLFDENLCSSWLDYKTMLEKFEILQFDIILNKVLNKSIDFKQKFIEEINDQDDDVIDLFQNHQYPID